MINGTKNIKILLICLALLMATIMGQGGISYLSQKLEVENTVKGRIQEALSKIIDSHKYVINVDVELEIVDEVEEQITMLSPRATPSKKKQLSPAQETAQALLEMQASAILEATAELIEDGFNVLPEIMIPLVGTVTEYIDQERIIRDVASKVESNYGVKLNYLVGTMIELPRACLTADEIAEHAEFFSFGTNDLTQTTFGFSRDDIGSFLPDYLERKILPVDPFQSLDINGVGKLVTMAVNYGREKNKNLKIGICGEHGGDPSSIHFCKENGLDYVSCSPFRVPIARLSAAQSEI